MHFSLVRFFDRFEDAVEHLPADPTRPLNPAQSLVQFVQVPDDLVQLGDVPVVCVLQCQRVVSRVELGRVGEDDKSGMRAAQDGVWSDLPISAGSGAWGNVCVRLRFRSRTSSLFVWIWKDASSDSLFKALRRI